VAPYAIILSAVGANYRGYTRKISGGAIIAAAFSIANIIGPQTFQDKDRVNGYVLILLFIIHPSLPKSYTVISDIPFSYMPAKYTLVASTSGSILVAVALRILYGYRNSRADKLGEPAMSHIEANAVRARLSVEFSDPGYRYEY